MQAGDAPVLVHNCSIDLGDMARMYIKSLYSHLDSLNAAGGNYEMMGITSSGRFCTTVNCYQGLLGRGLKMLHGIDETYAEEGYSAF